MTDVASEPTLKNFLAEQVGGTNLDRVLDTMPKLEALDAFVKLNSSKIESFYFISREIPISPEDLLGLIRRHYVALGYEENKEGVREEDGTIVENCIKFFDEKDKRKLVYFTTPSAEEERYTITVRDR